MLPISFNKPWLSGNELLYIEQAVKAGHISGNGDFTKKCHAFFKERLGSSNVLLTTSCTDALEMAALLARIEPGDEVIAPAYAFVSTVNAFALRGARIVFVDSLPHNPNLDPQQLEPLITNRTKAVVALHYAGIACDMDPIVDLARKANLLVIEDAAQAIDSYYKGKPLGVFGDFAAFSFHETKNLISGEGGLLVLNRKEDMARAEILWEKGTDRSAFFRGEVDRYSWVDLGSSFLPSEMIAAFLYAQLECLEDIQARRQSIWNHYYQALTPLEANGLIALTDIPDYATNNYHMFYLVCRSAGERIQLLEHLQQKKIQAVSHYHALHKSPYYTDQHDGRDLPNCDRYANNLIRLPFYYEISDEQLDWVIEAIQGFYSY